MTVTSVCTLAEDSGAKCLRARTEHARRRRGKNPVAHAFLRSSLFHEKSNVTILQWEPSYRSEEGLNIETHTDRFETKRNRIGGNHFLSSIWLSNSNFCTDQRSMHRIVRLFALLSLSLIPVARPLSRSTTPLVVKNSLRTSSSISPINVSNCKIQAEVPNSISRNITSLRELDVLTSLTSFVRIVTPCRVELTISSIHGFWSTGGTLTRSDVVLEVVLVVVIHVVVGVVVVVAGSAHVITCQ